MLSAQQFTDRLKSIHCFALDLDGTVYLGDQLFDFTQEFLSHLKNKNKDYMFLTNNSSKSPAQYLEKFAHMGLDIALEKIYTSAQATIEYLRQKTTVKKAFILGTEPLITYFESCGLQNESENPDAVILGFDLDFDYKRLHHATNLIRNGVPFYATHGDFTCPIENNQVLPDCGALTAALTAATGVEPVVFGKPNAPMAQGLLRRAGLEARQVAIVGDRLTTDIQTGALHGMLSILVLTGETDATMLERSNIQPDFCVPSLAELMAFF